MFADWWLVDAPEALPLAALTHRAAAVARKIPLNAALVLLFFYARIALREPLVGSLRPMWPELAGGDEPYGLDR